MSKMRKINMMPFGAFDPSEPHTMVSWGGWLVSPVIYDEQIHGDLEVLGRNFLEENSDGLDASLDGPLLWCVQAPERLGSEEPERMGTVLAHSFARVLDHIRYREATDRIGLN